ncbi:hypothetical protein HPY27_11635 [Brevibacillus sp. HB1.1]|uniref:hypothetical protein n=1 Tax=Brevibacillus sp. HB1.1 TaxID=2738808 RepID=UPI0015775653|nr:hypothetical protein [Brevibacillus sp. HB1.1]NTU30797.1 hypothetical protein [Brevibacillus sp. HB1.1]
MKKTKKHLSLLLLASMLGTGGAVPFNVLNMDTVARAASHDKQDDREAVEVTSIKSLNSITLEITFAEPLSSTEVELNNALKNFEFDNDLTIRNVPQRKTGFESTYIVPTTPQEEGTTYTFTYKGEEMGTFEASDEKINMREARQVSNDTIEIESRLGDRVTDYGNVIEAYAGKRGGLDFELDEDNRYRGREYQIISSLRGTQVTLTPRNGEPIVATYVPFTQNTDGVQEPKFRLPAGEELEPGVTYTVSSDWADFRDATFTARDVDPLTIQSVKAKNETTLDVTLRRDPREEIFPLRRITLTAPDGTELVAQYKFTTRNGTTGTFEIMDGKELESNVTYQVEPVGEWATARNVSVTTDAQPDENAEVQSIKSLNPITLEVTLSAPLVAEDLVLAKAQENFQFDNGLTIRNIPQLKTGTIATYYVPTTPQTSNMTYTLTYKDEMAGTFETNSDLIDMVEARQVAYDTIEIESSLRAGVTDYENVIASYVGKRNGLDFVLDQNNQYRGKNYEIIPSLRTAQVYITPEGGEPIVATYVPFTQATDGRQEPKFRLPAGETLIPGVEYTVTTDWADIKDSKFTAKAINPLTIRSVNEVNPTTLEVRLSNDPRDELFASRQIKLTAPDGTELVAQYKVTTRKGSTGIFEMMNGGKLEPNTMYSVTPVGQWAGLTFTTK